MTYVGYRPPYNSTVKGLSVFPLKIQTFQDLLHSHNKWLQAETWQILLSRGRESFFLNNFKKAKKINKCLPLQFTPVILLIGKAFREKAQRIFTFCLFYKLEILILAWKSNFAAEFYNWPPTHQIFNDSSIGFSCSYL